jgi:tetratricopeptide (TPR) repeat protein
MTAFRTALSLAVLLVTALPALALENILLEDGSVRKGEILRVEENGLMVKGRTLKGDMVEILIPADKLDAVYFYDQRDNACGTDAKARLRLALWAVDKGLFSRAQVQVQKAAEADPKLIADIREGKLPEIREGIAAHVLASARKDLVEGRLDNALQKVERLLVRAPDTPAGAEAADFLPEVEAAIALKAEKDHEKKMAALAEADRKVEEAREKILEPVREALKKAREVASKGLQEDNDNNAINALGQALEMGQSALADTEAILKKATEDAVLAEQAAALKEEITRALVKGYVHRGEMYLWRSSVPQAKEQADKAAELIPDDPSIEALQAQILSAEQDNDYDGNWRRGPAGGSRFGGRRGGGGGGRR